MIKTRAIFIGDVRYDNCPVFELKDNGYFEMLVEAAIDMRRKK